MRESRPTRTFIPRADVISDRDRNNRRVVILNQQHSKAIFQFHIFEIDVDFSRLLSCRRTNKKRHQNECSQLLHMLHIDSSWLDWCLDPDKGLFLGLEETILRKQVLDIPQTPGAAHRTSRRESHKL